MGYSAGMEPTAPAAPERPRRRLGWPTVAIALATLLIGGFIGYAAGRPNVTPPVHGALSPGQVRVPDLRAVAAKDAAAVLGPLDLQVGPIGLRQSQEAPTGIVIEQDPPGGTAVPAGTEIDLVASSGPGPGASALYEFARSVLLPITHTGTIEWTSDPIALDGDPLSLGANTRVIGHAGVSPYRVSVAKAEEPGTTAITISVDVASFRSPAWFLIERAFSRQRETSALDADLVVTPSHGPPGTVVTLEGHQCEGSSPRATVTVTAEFSHANGNAYASLPLPVPGSAYAFRMTFTIPASIQAPTGSVFVKQPDRVAFVASGGVCRSSFDVR